MGLKKQQPLKRGAGVLLAVSSLPSPYGIGSFGKAAYDFVDFLKESGMIYWQILPLNPTSYGDSPYQSFSVFAGSPYYIDPDILVRHGLLTEEEVAEPDWGEAQDSVDYSALYSNRFALLKRAFSRVNIDDFTEFVAFCEEHGGWLDDYALFMAIKDSLGGIKWTEWPDGLRLRNKSAMDKAMDELREEVKFWKICQFYFYRQWGELKAYANSRGVHIIGDMPIYVALDSCDLWSNYGLFQVDKNRLPTHVAGVPPDMFSKTGQLWGNPLYNWAEMERQGFDWWQRRMHLYSKMYDIIRIDHFVGIVHYYSIPAGAEDAVKGEWLPGPGEKLLLAISQYLDGGKIIAEDLGRVTMSVIKLRKKAGYPGMKLYQMAFDSDGKNQNLPGYYDRDTVAYGGTHDNETNVGFLAGQKRRVLRFAREYLGVRLNRDIPWAMIRTAFASSAAAVIFQMQDYLTLDNRARMNTPSTVGGNWKWRMTAEQISDELTEKLKRYCEVYGR